MTRLNRHSGGFTLLEVLIAMALLSLVMSMLMTALGASLRVVDALSQQDEANLQAQTALRRLGDDLAAAYAEPALPFQASQGETQLCLHGASGFRSRGAVPWPGADQLPG